MRPLILALTLLLLVVPAHAQHPAALFSRVQPERVTLVTAADGMGVNEREWGGTVAQSVAVTLRTLTGEYVGKDRIQPYTWDFQTWEALDYTPLAFMAAVREDWWLDGVLYQHYTRLACYDVGDLAVYDCYQSQGTAQDLLMGWHYNSVQVTRADAARVLDALFKY